MATNWEEGVKMVDAKAANVRLFVVKQNRFNTLEACQKAGSGRRFGKLAMVTVMCFGNVLKATTTMTVGGTWALDGGALMNQASHYIDLLIGRVSRKTERIHRNIGT